MYHSLSLKQIFEAQENYFLRNSLLIEYAMKLDINATHKGKHFKLYFEKNF